MSLHRHSVATRGARVDQIDFDRRKYGPELLADACAIRDIPGFITAPRSHRLMFHEIAFITQGRGRLDIDHASLDVAPRRVLVTGPGEVRRWRLDEPGLEGVLVFFESEFIDAFFGDTRFLASLPLMAASPEARAVATPGRAFDAVMDIAGLMCGELKAPRIDTHHALRADTYRLLIALQRLAVGRLNGERRELQANRLGAHRLARRFTDLVERHHAEHHDVAAYAARLDVSPRHLNACVREATGKTPSETIHCRQFLEARRLLSHTALGVGAIAERLGFADASYFIRFFKRHAGQTPLAWRAGRESAISLPAVDLPRSGG